MTTSENPSVGAGTNPESGPEDSSEGPRGLGASFADRLPDRAHWFGPDALPWGHWVIAALLLAFLGLATVAVANVAVNPRADFSHRWYPPLVGDDPLEKVKAYDALPAPTPRLVLGSSRAAQLPPGNATSSGFNFAIPGGGLQDDRIAYEFVRGRQPPPSHVILGLDSFQLDGADYRDVAVHRSQAAPELTGEGLSVHQWTARALGTLQPRYSYDTARSLFYANVAGYPAHSRATASDGVESWSKVEQSRAAGTFDLAKQIETNWRESVSGRYSAGRAVDPAAVAAAGELVHRISADGAQVQVILLPIHPDVLARLGNETSFPRLQAAAVALARGWCSPAVSVFDYTETRSIGVLPSEFYDGIHLAPEGAARVAVALERGEGNLCRGE